MSPPPDFESGASANSATSAWLYQRKLLYYVLLVLSTEKLEFNQSFLQLLQIDHLIRGMHRSKVSLAYLHIPLPRQHQ